MSMKVTKRNFRVVVEPRNPGDFGMASIGGQTRSEEDSFAICQDIADGIRRHVDNLPFGGSRGVYIEFDEYKECSHCGCEWFPDEDGRNNCCATDEKEHQVE